MSIKLIALDMDGTLLNSKKELPEEFIPWVKSHPEVKVAIASGRQYYTLERDFIPIKDQLVFIAENGAFVFYKGEMIYKDPMNREQVLKSLDLIEKIPNAVPVISGAKSAFLTLPNEEVKYNTDMYYVRQSIVDDLRKVVDEDVVAKVAVFFEGGKAEASRKYFENLGEDMIYALSGDCWIDIMNRSTGKGNALKAIGERYGISPAETMAFGDYLNDLTLLQACEESYCMKNGHPELKAVAKYVTEKTNDENGVMETLKARHDFAK